MRITGCSWAVTLAAKARTTIKTKHTANAKIPGHVIACAFQPRQESHSKPIPKPQPKTRDMSSLSRSAQRIDDMSRSLRRDTSYLPWNRTRNTAKQNDDGISCAFVYVLCVFVHFCAFLHGFACFRVFSIVFVLPAHVMAFAF